MVHSSGSIVLGSRALGSIWLVLGCRMSGSIMSGSIALGSIMSGSWVV
jgi:hypothetical protein